MPSATEMKRESAEAAARALVNKSSSIEAVLLYGSVARGDAKPESDVDLMMVASQPLRAPQLRKALGEEHRSVSVTCHSWESLAQAREQEWSFFVHLCAEGDVLYGERSGLKRNLAKVRCPERPIWMSRLEDELSGLERFDDLSRFGAGYQFAMARIFRTARYGCMMENTAAGEYAFSRDRCFDLFADRHPEVADETVLLAGLWPFQARAQGRRKPSLPFKPDSEENVIEAREAARSVLEAALRG